MIRLATKRKALSATCSGSKSGKIVKKIEESKSAPSIAKVAMVHFREVMLISRNRRIPNTVVRMPGIDMIGINIRMDR